MFPKQVLSLPNGQVLLKVELNLRQQQHNAEIQQNLADITIYLPVRLLIMK